MSWMSVCASRKVGRMTMDEPIYAIPERELTETDRHVLAVIRAGVVPTTAAEMDTRNEEFGQWDRKIAARRELRVQEEVVHRKRSVRRVEKATGNELWADNG